MSVAQRLARLSKQYPFYPSRCSILTRPTVHHRYLASQASVSRAAERKQADDIPQQPTDSEHVNGDTVADAASATPPPLFAPLLGSILNFIQRRAQPAQQSTTSTPHNTTTQTLTQHASPSTSASSSPSLAVDLDDPAISHLFPRLPLPQPPPLYPRPPFPVPPVTRTTTLHSPTAYAAYNSWFNSLPQRTQLHVVLGQAATADARFVLWLERMVARKGEAGWEEEMAALSRRRMAQVRARSRREQKLLEAMWRREKTEVEWRQIERGREKLKVESRGRQWQERWLSYDRRLKSDGGTADQRQMWQYERNRAETEIRANVRLLGLLDEEAIDAKVAELMRETQNGTLNEWRWPDKAAVKRRERALSEWKARTVRSALAEQEGWHDKFAKEQAAIQKMVVRQSRRQAVAKELRAIDWSNPPQTFDELLASFCYRHSKRYKLELWKHGWYITEIAMRSLELPLNDTSRHNQNQRYRARLHTEAKLFAAVQAEHAAAEQRKRRSIRSIVRSHLLRVGSQMTGWHVYQLLRSVVGEGQLVGLSSALPQRTSEDVFSGASVAGMVPPAPLPPSIAVTPISWPLMLSYVSESARASVPVVRVREEDDGSSGTNGASSGNIVIELRNARRDVVVWMYEAMREVRMATDSSDAVTWGQVVRVGRDGETEGDGDSVEAVRDSASDAGGEHGWCVLDMGAVVVQTHSEDDTSGVTARRWLSEEDAKKRLSAVSVSRINIITAAG